jgi:hypothetical protein
MKKLNIAEYFRQTAKDIFDGKSGALNNSSNSLIIALAENETEYHILNTLKELVKLEMRADLIKQVNTFLHFSNLEEVSK